MRECGIAPIGGDEPNVAYLWVGPARGPTLELKLHGAQPAAAVHDDDVASLVEEPVGGSRDLLGGEHVFGATGGKTDA
ncbi:Uncharacterised protein [Mycobacteroides abscessus subsp. abscessus]|nr:Uncharacterised protein [Mycobacteroides abscessus subsp. abscessus]